MKLVKQPPDQISRWRFIVVDGLPLEEDEYLVAMRDPKSVLTMYFREDRRQFGVNDEEDGWADETGNIVAWMPMPEHPNAGKRRR